MASRERMTAVDTAWLRMDRPDNLMMITGIMILRDNLEFAGHQRDRAVIADRQRAIDGRQTIG